MDIIIFGAQAIATSAYEAIQRLHQNRKVLYFLVSERGDNPKSIHNVPVVELNQLSQKLNREEKENIEVIIATPENVMEEIEKSLDEFEFYNHICLTSLRFAELMSYYYIHDRKFMPLCALPIGIHRADVQMFVAKWFKDKPLKRQMEYPKWVFPIQVGAASTEVRVAEVLDNEGENISNKNVNYSELTALYWIWKNCLQDKTNQDKLCYLGLSHYRRILSLTDDDIYRLVDNDVDVVMPYPLIHEPNIELHHRRYLKEEDWNAVLIVLRELEPEYADYFPKVLKQRFFYNYNIMLAKKKILRDYCNWLFPILERIEEVSMPKGCERADRYIGYISETLGTLYFIKNSNQLNIKHTGCEFLI